MKSDNELNPKQTDIEEEDATGMTDDEIIDFVAARILKLYRPAFEELAKG